LGPIVRAARAILLRVPDDVHVPDDELRWRVSPKLIALKVAGAVAFPLVALAFGGDPARLVFGVLAGLVLAAYALRDVLVPVRVAADASGVTVATGYAGHRRLPWSSVEKIQVYQRQRLGTRSELLEIDTGESLHLFSAYELNAPCVEVAEALEELREAAGDR
jgi:hypothetical protein